MMLVNTGYVQELPQETIDDILHYLWNDRAALQALSSTCRSFTPTCQKLLFFSIFLRSEYRSQVAQARTPPPPFQNLYQVLLGAPHLAEHIRQVWVEDFEPKGDQLQHKWLKEGSPHLGALLSLLPNVSTFCLFRSLYIRKNWGYTSSEVLGELAQLLRSPKLNRLELTRTPLALLNHCSMLKHLYLHELCVPRIDLPHVVHTGKRPQLDTFILKDIRLPEDEAAQVLLQIPQALDLSRLRKLAVGLADSDEGHLLLSRLLHASSETLEHLAYISVFKGYTNVPSTIAKIDLSNSTSLRVLNVRFSPWGRCVVHQFLSILRTIPRTNRLESIAFSAQPVWNEENSDVNVWTAITDVLTHNCPALRRVEFGLSFTNQEDLTLFAVRIKPRLQALLDSDLLEFRQGKGKRRISCAICEVSFITF
ncbi:hypothetical protein B0H34DRAFT_476846 [Crassisporium funariophilum]|nr:hypothetical protein B0H34DRAFT_476846 [Crassisporium funariophilum]